MIESAECCRVVTTIAAPNNDEERVIAQSPPPRHPSTMKTLGTGAWLASYASAVT
jgi:hypothetical protein